MFRILSLDGGGIRGAFAAAFLARVEAELGDPITDYFDLIAGTSTGGIIALALALGESAEKVTAFYQDHGAVIFAPRKESTPVWERVVLRLGRRYLRSFNSSSRSKYDSTGLRAALAEVYGNRTLEDAKCTRLVIPAVDLVQGKTITFKTPHQPDFVRDRHHLAVDVGLATSAAPTFFPQAEVEPGSSYSDGGLWANNPAMVGFVEAMKIASLCRRPGIDTTFGTEEVHMLSLGTGEARYYALPKTTDLGFSWWAPRIFDVAAGAQSQGIHFQTSYLLGKRYTRVNFEMPTPPWALDEVHALPQLLHHGTQKAVETFPSLRGTLFRAKKPAYHPFA